MKYIQNYLNIEKAYLILKYIYNDILHLKISLEDCVLDELSLREHLRKHIWNLSYKLLSAAFILFYIFECNGRCFSGRFSFCIIALYFLFRANGIFFPLSSNIFCMLSGIAEGFCSSIVFSYIFPYKITELLVLNCLLSILWYKYSYLLNISYWVFIYIPLLNGCIMLYNSVSFYQTVSFICSFYIILYCHYNVFNSNESALLYNLSKIKDAYEKSEQTIKSKNMFVASITHDLKNPLNSILGTIDMLKGSKTLSDKDKAMLITSSYSGQVLLYLIGNILDASKIEAGKFDVDMIPMNIEDELLKIYKIEFELAKQKGVKLYKKTITEFPKMVFGDPMRFTQILINLIGNAIKFTSQGYVAIVARWARNAQEAKDFSSIETFSGSMETHNTFAIPPEEYFLEESKANRQNRAVTPIRKKKSLLKQTESTTATIYLPTHLNEDISENIITDHLREKLHKYKEHPKKIHFFQPKSISSNQKICFTSFDSPDKRKKDYLNINRSCQRIPGDESSPRSLNDSGIMVVEIIDTGPGMTTEETQRLFKPFSQANSSVKRKFGGTGLGLWITKQLVDLMNGLIEVHSQQGKGSIFKITIPFKIIEKDEQAIKPSSNLPEETQFKKQSTLSVEGFQRVSTRLGLKLNTDLRKKGEITIKGKNTSFSKLQILILENENIKDNEKLDQIVSQFTNFESKIYFTTYNKSLLYLQSHNYDFKAIILIAGKPLKSSKILVQSLQSDKEIKKIPIIVAAELCEQDEYQELVEDKIITFPLKNGALTDLIATCCLKAKKLVTLGKKMEKIIEDLHKGSSFHGSFNIKSRKKLPFVIIADDDSFSNTILRAMIEQSDKYAVTSCYNGLEAVNSFKNAEQDLIAIILDFEMPGMSGLEAATKIREIEKAEEKSRISIIGLTGHETEEAKQAAMEAGMDYVITKPIKRQVLFTLLDQCKI